MPERKKDYGASTLPGPEAVVCGEPGREDGTDVDLAKRNLIGNIVKEMRVHLGVSQEALAELIGSTQDYISKVERHKADPSWEFVIRLYAVASLAEMDALEKSMSGLPGSDCGRDNLPRTVRGATAVFKGLLRAGVLPTEIQDVVRGFIEQWEDYLAEKDSRHISDVIRRGFMQHRRPREQTGGSGFSPDLPFPMLQRVLFGETVTMDDLLAIAVGIVTSTQYLEHLAQGLWNDFSQTHTGRIIRPPLPIEDLARHLGCLVEKAEVEPHSVLSPESKRGELLAESNHYVIRFWNWTSGTRCLNRAHFLRFTVAHEIAHLVLVGDGKAAPQAREAERDADRLAGALLMPAKTLEIHMSALPSPSALARVFAVPLDALHIRLRHLREAGLIDHANPEKPAFIVGDVRSLSHRREGLGQTVLFPTRRAMRYGNPAMSYVRVD